MDEHTKVTGATGAAIGISSVAAFMGLCCVGPWAVSLFGVSAAVAMAKYDFLRPYLIVVAGAALVWAFWRIYVRGPRSSLRLQGALWFAAVLTVAAFFADELQWWLVDPTPGALAAEVSPMSYIEMDSDLAELRADFNEQASEVRLLYIVGPT